MISSYITIVAYNHFKLSPSCRERGGLQILGLKGKQIPRKARIEDDITAYRLKAEVFSLPVLTNPLSDTKEERVLMKGPTVRHTKLKNNEAQCCVAECKGVEARQHHKRIEKVLLAYDPELYVP